MSQERKIESVIEAGVQHIQVREKNTTHVPCRPGMPFYYIASHESDQDESDSD